MYTIKNIMGTILVLFLSAFILAACGGGGGATTTPPTVITSFELIDPTPRALDQFGKSVIILSNGNVVVADPNDSSVDPSRCHSRS